MSRDPDCDVPLAIGSDIVVNAAPGLGMSDPDNAPISTDTQISDAKIKADYSRIQISSENPQNERRAYPNDRHIEESDGELKQIQTLRNGFNEGSQTTERTTRSVPNGIQNGASVTNPEAGCGRASPSSAPPRRHLEGGWGWVCVVSYFFMNILTGGIVSTFSLISIELQAEHGVSAQMAGWVYSVNMLFFMLSGPLCTALCKMFSCRRVAVISAFTLSVSLIFLGYGPNMIYVFLGYSVLGGIANGMHSVVAALIIGEYFNKKRGKATGLLMSGKNVGQMVYAPLLSFMFLYYGYRDGLLMTSAFTLHLCIGSALLRSPETKRKVVGDDAGNPEHLKQTAGDEHVFAIENLPLTDHVIVKDGIMPEELFVADDRRDVIAGDKSEARSRPTSRDWSPKFAQLLADEKPRAEVNAGTGSRFRRSVRRLTTFLDVTLLAEPLFLAYGVLFAMTSSMSLALYNTCIAGIVEDRGFDRQQVASLLAASGGLGFLAKIVSGFLFDLRPVRPHRIHAFTALYMLAAALMLSVPAVRGTTALFVHWLSYTTIISFIGCQTSVIAVDIVGVHRHPSAVGLSMPFRGVGILMGPPLAGYLRDLTHSYDMSMYTCGSISLATACILEVTVLLNRTKINDIRRRNFTK